MSVFEELIDELKEEELLEETIFSLNRTDLRDASSDVDPIDETTLADPMVQADDSSFVGADDEGDDAKDEFLNEQPVDEREAYRKRAMDEVSTLQMVEHVLSGIEREHMKMTPATFDDLEVKKSLHKYLQTNAPASSEDRLDVERELFQETERWFSALSKRDSNISVANVRRFCENSRPVLSSQALMALAKFYRNSPYAEAVRGKFDFVMTRLFSREVGDEKRKLLFGRVEMLGHIQTLYGNWASLSILDPEDADSPSLGAAVSGFEAFVQESESADTFDQLISSDFFNRIRLFKEQTNELFLEPAVTAAAIECNVRIGNRFVDLVQREREATGEASIEERYGYTYDTIISTAASKTLLLLDLLRQSRPEADEEANQAASPVQKKVVDFERAPVEDNSPSWLFSVNKWVVVATILAFIVTGGLYLWSENAAATDSSIEVARGIDINGSDLKAHLREASTSGETFYAVTDPTWDALSEDEKKQFLSKALEFARTKGLKQVNFLSARGRTVGFASDSRSEIFDPQ